VVPRGQGTGIEVAFRDLARGTPMLSKVRGVGFVLGVFTSLIGGLFIDGIIETCEGIKHEFRRHSITSRNI
jgi:hypothetical protein